MRCFKGGGGGTYNFCGGLNDSLTSDSTNGLQKPEVGLSLLHIASPWNTAWSLSGVVGLVNEKQFSIREANLDSGRRLLQAANS